MPVVTEKLYSNQRKLTTLTNQSKEHFAKTVLGKYNKEKKGLFLDSPYGLVFFPIRQSSWC